MPTPLDLSHDTIHALRDARSVVVLTGAGVSAESGVPTFRGKEGLWRNYSPQELATPEAFNKDPNLVWEWYDWRRGLIAPLEPNPSRSARRRSPSLLKTSTASTKGPEASACSSSTATSGMCVAWLKAR